MSTPVPIILKSNGVIVYTNLDFAHLLAGNGYAKLPSGLTIQWGSTGLIANGSSQTISLPIAFATAFYAAYGVLASSANAPSLSYSCGAEPTGLSQITVRNHSAAGNIAARWFAIGI